MSCAVIGWALETPLGGSIEAHVDALCRAPVLRPVTRPPPPAGGRHHRLLGALGGAAVDVALAAVADAGGALTTVDRVRLGVYAAVGALRADWEHLAPAFADQREDGADAWALGLGRLHPLWMLRFLSNGAHGACAAELGAGGDGATFSGPAAVAAAVAAAEDALAAGVIDAAVIVAADSLCSTEAMLELASRRADAVPAAAVAALVVCGDGQAAARAHLAAVASVDHQHLDPSPDAIAAVRAQLGAGAAGFATRRHLGEVGAAALAIDVIVAAAMRARGLAPRGLDVPPTGAIHCISAGRPGQIGVIRVEVAR